MVSGNLKTPMIILLGTVAFVLLIAVANVANLVLARAAARGRDLAIRAALGADRGRLVTQMLVESVVLAACGGIVGIGLARAMIRVLSATHAGTLPRVDQASIDGSVLAVTAGISLVAGLLFGLAPALQLSRPALNSVLQDSSRGATSGRGRVRLRQGLAVVQMTLSVVLVLGAGLLTRSLIALNRVELGFDTTNVVTAQVQLRPAAYPAPADVIRFYRLLEEQWREIPGIRHAGLTRVLPLSRTIGDWSITIEGSHRRRQRIRTETFNGSLPDISTR